MPFISGESVIYISKPCTLFKTPGKRLLQGDTEYGYLIKENKSGIVHDNINESDLNSCNPSLIYNDYWDDFIYTGDNKEASKWITENIIKHLNIIGNLEWGHNENSQYFLKINGITLLKDRL